MLNNLQARPQGFPQQHSSVESVSAQPSQDNSGIAGNSQGCRESRDSIYRCTQSLMQSAYNLSQQALTLVKISQQEGFATPRTLTDDDNALQCYPMSRWWVVLKSDIACKQRSWMQGSTKTDGT